MSCTHKFFGHDFHQRGEKGLLPNWNAKTLIIGTFNPNNNFYEQNSASYFYGRKRNYFWDILPLFAGEPAIDKSNSLFQKCFLENKKIAITDLLISINDAELNNTEHIRRIKSVKDKEIEKFHSFNWNTEFIKNYIEINKVEAVYFTYLSNPSASNQLINTFEFQTRLIESYCQEIGVFTSRLFTPSGQGLRNGTPRKNKLINKWYNENQADRFPFLSNQFNIQNYNYR
jgi:hypothetical protein